VEKTEIRPVVRTSYKKGEPFANNPILDPYVKKIGVVNKDVAPKAAKKYSAVKFATSKDFPLGSKWDIKLNI